MRSSRLVGYLILARDSGGHSWRLVRDFEIVGSERPGAYRVWEQRRRADDPAPERLCVTLGRGHRYANSAGYQRLARFLIADALGYLPDPMTHSHHRDRNSLNDAIDNLELISAVYHGRIHASGVCVGRGRDGRFIPLEKMGAEEQLEIAQEVWIPRRGAVMGNSARR